MMELKESPNKWCVVKVDLIGELLRGVNYNKIESSIVPQENYLPILRSNNIQEKLIFEDLVFVDKKNFSEYHSLKSGDIVFAMSSGSKHLVGKSARVIEDCAYGWGAFCSVLRPYELLNKSFVSFYFQAPFYKKYISNISKGTNINNLKKEYILELDFPLPPLPEQHRIVAKIEELFSELDKGIESLKTAQEQLKVYRQAVLKYAFQGKLTNPDAKEGERPEGWVKSSLGSITLDKTGLRRGPFGSAIKKEFFVPQGFKVYEQSNAIYNDHKRGHYYINESKFLELKNFEVKEGDFLVSCSGTLGKISQIPVGAQKGVINQALLRIRLIENTLLSKYFLYYFRSEMFQRMIFDQSQGTAMNNLIGIKDFKEITIVFPEKIAEQQKVVDEIESRLSVCDKIEESITQGLAQAEALRQSILKKAFEGKLVPQDPNDEPASVLLERIRAERAAAQSEKKKKVNS